MHIDDPRFAEAFWARVNKNGPVLRPDLGPCWVWTGGATINVGDLAGRLAEGVKA